MKKPPKKKETTLSVLQEIRDLMKHPPTNVIRYEVNAPVTLANELLVDFPSMTAKEIFEQSKDSVDGGRLFYSVDWYAQEDFYTKEKTRAGKRYVSKEVLHKGESWNEINEKTSPNTTMLSMAEVMYLLWKYPEFRPTLAGSYIWTSSRASDGILVFVGDFGSLGANVDGWDPGNSDSNVGVCFSRSE